ncbi:MAG: hypothetical protein AMXMBFR59_42500 [Rhodanobacteraceae bacterium]
MPAIFATTKAARERNGCSPRHARAGSEPDPVFVTRNEITVCEGKGGADRETVLPERLWTAMQAIGYPGQDQFDRPPAEKIAAGKSGVRQLSGVRRK